MKDERFLAILLQRLGGRAVITDDDLRDAPAVTVVNVEGGEVVLSAGQTPCQPTESQSETRVSK